MTDSWTKLNIDDRHLRKLFDSFLQICTPDIVCDIGALDGKESAHFRSILPHSEIFLFEPSVRNYAAICQNEMLAGIEKVHAAACDFDGSATFYEMEVSDSLTDWKRGAGSLKKRTDDLATRATTVRTTALDSFFRNEIKNEKLFILWIDAEGSLSEIISGGQNVLRRTLVVRGEIERYEYWEGQALARTCFAALENLGFIVLGETYCPGVSEQSDALFLNRSWLDLLAKRELLRVSYSTER